VRGHFDRLDSAQFHAAPAPFGGDAPFAFRYTGKLERAVGLRFDLHALEALSQDDLRGSRRSAAGVEHDAAHHMRRNRQQLQFDTGNGGAGQHSDRGRRFTLGHAGIPGPPPNQHGAVRFPIGRLRRRWRKHGKLITAGHNLHVKLTLSIGIFHELHTQRGVAHLGAATAAPGSSEIRTAVGHHAGPGHFEPCAGHALAAAVHHPAGDARPRHEAHLQSHGAGGTDIDAGAG
jgi:hypothetical protein